MKIKNNDMKKTSFHPSSLGNVLNKFWAEISYIKNIMWYPTYQNTLE